MSQLGDLIGVIDEGMTSTDFLIFKAGTDDLVCHHQVPVPIHHPQEGWCEQNPIDIYKAVVESMKVGIGNLQRLGGSAKDIIAIGITNQRQTTIVWDRTTGQPLYNAIIWLDNRTLSTVDELIESISGGEKSINYIRPQCGLPLSPYFSALKLRWLKDNVAKVKSAMENENCLFGTIDTWLIYNLTGGPNNGVHVTDVTNASRTMLMNLETLLWDPVLLNFFDLPPSILPEIRSSSEIYGKVTLEFLQGVPIAACIGDQQAALIGQQCLQRGQVNCSCGTGCFLLYNTGNKIVHSKNGLFTTVGYQLGSNVKPTYALEGSIAVAGTALTWLRDNMGIVSSMDDIEPMARMVDSNMDVYFVPAFNGLFAPHWNQDARGIICGLTEETTSEHIVRATLEAICFQVRDILEAMKKDYKTSLTMLMIDGAMTCNKFLLQLFADLLGFSIVRANLTETTALGAALAAYKAVQPNFNLDGPISNMKERTIYKPSIKNNERDISYHKWKLAIERSLNWDIYSTIETKQQI